MLKAVIFDFDGVIYNTPKYVFKARDIYLSKFNIKITKKQDEKLLLIPTKDAIKWINNHFKVNINYKQYLKETKRIENQLLKNKNLPKPGVRRLINSLIKNNIKIAIATSCKRKVLLERLKKIGLKDKFNTLVSVEDIKKHKPFPDEYLFAAKKLKVDPKDCVALEDAPLGVRAINKAKMKSIGVLGDFTKPIDFKKENANLIIKSISELTLKKLKEL